MSESETKCVMLIDGSLPVGVVANTAAILGVTLGTKAPECVGCDVADANGFSHTGIVNIPIPILKADSEVLKSIRGKLREPNYADLVTVDFSDVAQCCRTYDQYIRNAADTGEEDFTYLGIVLYGPKTKVNRLTGSMPLLR